MVNAYFEEKKDLHKLSVYHWMMDISFDQKQNISYLRLYCRRCIIEVLKRLLLRIGFFRLFYNNITWLMTKILHVRFTNLQILHSNGIEESYYSLNYGEKHYFSSSFHHENTAMEDDILIELESIPPETISLQRWENCMIVFNFDVEIVELRSRAFTRKTIETKHQEFLSLHFQLYDAKDILFTEKYIENISQHYLIIQDLFFLHEKHQARAAKQPNYFTITTKNSSFVVPLREAVVLVKVPDSIEITSFVNNVYNGKSGFIKYDKINKNDEISIDKDGKFIGKVSLKTRWAINLHRCQVDQNLLIQSNQLMLYDFELKFDNPVDIVGCRLKISHGSKAFDFTEDIDKNKVTKIKKVVFFIVKSQIQEIDFVIQKTGKVISHCRLSISQLAQNSLTLIKKKWLDINNPAKAYGFIKMRGQRSRNLSVPQSNKYWRDVLRRKHSLTNMMISIHQISVYFSNNQALSLVAKVQNEEKVINSLTNINFFDQQDQPSNEVLQFPLKGEQSLYLIVKTDLKSSDFCGIGVVNTTDLKLGTNTCEVPFFKNQQKAGTLNCLINKMIFWPFLKPLFQSEPQLLQQQALVVDLFFNSIRFTPYFYTFRYDGKEEVYCIVEVNKIKKVLILQNTEHDQLNFFAAAGSDALNYQVQHPDLIKIKITFLVSDLGHQEEIYGAATCKIKGSQLSQQTVKLKNIEILNDYSVVLGSINLQGSKGTSPKVSPKNKTADNQKPSVGSFDLSQASFDTNILPQKGASAARRYSGGSVNTPKSNIHNFLKKNTGRHLNDVKLPVIKQKKHKDSFLDLLSLMKVRKRQLGGVYEQKGAPSAKPESKILKKERHSFDLRKLQQSNPNLDRNLQILFPKKANDKFIQNNRSRVNDYDQKMKGLRSVMNEISDIGEVEPSIRESQPEGRYENEDFDLPEAEWEGNQFAEM